MGKLIEFVGKMLGKAMLHPVTLIVLYVSVSPFFLSFFVWKSTDLLSLVRKRKLRQFNDATVTGL